MEGAHTPIFGSHFPPPIRGIFRCFVLRRRNAYRVQRILALCSLSPSPLFLEPLVDAREFYSLVGFPRRRNSPIVFLDGPLSDPHRSVGARYPLGFICLSAFCQFLYFRVEPIFGL